MSLARIDLGAIRGEELSAKESLSQVRNRTERQRTPEKPKGLSAIGKESNPHSGKSSQLS